MEEKILNILTEIQNKLIEHDSRFERIDSKFERIDSRFERIDGRFERIERKLVEHDNRFDQLERKIEKEIKVLGDELHTEIQVVNDNVEDAVSRLQAILIAEHCSAKRMSSRI